MGAGFGESVEDYVNENREYMKKKTERLENLILIQGSKAVSAAKGKITDALTYKDALIKKGFSINAVNGIFDETGLAGLKTTYDTLEDRDDLLPRHVKKMSSVYETKFNDLYGDSSEFAGSSDFITDQLNRDLGLVRDPSEETDPGYTETGLVGSMFGLTNRAYNDVLKTESPLTGMTGEATLRTIGLVDSPSRGRGGNIDFSLLPYEPLPISQHDDDLEPLNSVMNEALRKRIVIYINYQRLKDSTDDDDKAEYEQLSRNWNAANNALHKDEKFMGVGTDDLYGEWLVSQKTLLGELQQETEVTGKLSTYLRMGPDAQADILQVFKSYDANGYASGYRDRVLENIYIPTDIKEWYGRYLKSPAGEAFLNSLNL